MKSFIAAHKLSIVQGAIVAAGAVASLIVAGKVTTVIASGEIIPE